MSHNSLIKCQISSTTHNISLSLTIKMDNCKVINAIEKIIIHIYSMPIQKLEYSNTRFGFDIKMSRIGEKSVIICMYWHPAVLVGYSMYNCYL